MIFFISKNWLGIVIECHHNGPYMTLQFVNRLNLTVPWLVTMYTSYVFYGVSPVFRNQYKPDQTPHQLHCVRFFEQLEYTLKWHSDRTHNWQKKLKQHNKKCLSITRNLEAVESIGWWTNNITNWLVHVFDFIAKKLYTATQDLRCGKEDVDVLKYDFCPYSS